jgi:DNA repair exonuclease SbcCD ATPase subunit
MTKLSELQDHLETKMRNALSESEQLYDGHLNVKEGIHNTRKVLGEHGGAKAALENHKAVQKQIRILENRLDKGLQKFNEAIEANRALREQIDTLRRERVVFDDIYRKLENELHAKKKEMANIIEQANAAYEARDSAQAQMAALKQQADKEHAEFEKEWRSLGELIENDKKMKDHMRKQVRSRVEDVKSEAGISDENQSRKKIAPNAWDSARSMVNMNSAQAKVTEYEDAFAKIQAATGISDIDQLVQNFIDSEDNNFTLFKYNNELSADMEKLETQIAEHKDEHISLSGTGTKKEDTEKVKILESLEEKWSDIDKKAQLYTEKHQDANQTLKHIQLGIESIFRRIGCTIEDLPSGSGVSISEANMITYLGIIEDRTNDLLKLYDQLREDDDDDVVVDSKSKPGQSSSNLQIKLPSTVEDYSEDEDDDDEDDQRPFTREELQIKTKKGISKRQKKSKKGPSNL